MTRNLPRALAIVTCLFAGACAELTGPQQDTAVTSAFSSVLLGFNNVQSSFEGGPEAGGAAWTPGARGAGGGGGGLCAGGLGGLFLGGNFGLGFGRGLGDPALSGTCTFNAASGRVVCEPVTRDGLTIARSASYRAANGTTQTAFDSLTTNTINVQIAVSGTTTRRNGATSTVQHASDRTVSGLAAGSTQRTVNGNSAGRETTTGTNDQGTFSALRIMGDTINNVVIPVQTGANTYPTSGTVIRSMQATLTYEGQTPVTSMRREVITYNGTNTATVVITRDGVSQTCSLPLPHGRPTCQ
jgi:hypothetical protein